MLLAIDCGNTNTVMGLFDGLNKRAEWRMATDSKRTAEDHAVWFHHHRARGGLLDTPLTGCVISTVVPACLRGYRELAEQHLGLDTFVIDAKRGDHGVAIRIDDAAQAGADRIANTKGAARHNLPALVIDFGTATTFDMVDRDGAYIGGAIAPGVNLSVDALYGAAAQLPLIDTAAWSADTPIIGKTTVDAMNSGLYYGYISLVEGMISRLQSHYGTPLSVIATGGLAGIFSRAVGAITHHDPDLTLKGMVMIYLEQKRRHSD